MRRHICVWSGKRGGFGALTPTIKELAKYEGVKVSVVVTDQHLYEKFGKTLSEVQQNFEIAAAIDMEQRGDSNRDRARAVGVCLAKSADVLADLKPDSLLVIGDRGEVFAACIAAHNLRIAIAHVQGGDISGSLDEPVRHAITKLAHIHFPSTEESAKRIIAMGEEPNRVHVVGDTHIDQILSRPFTKSDELAERYKIDLKKPFLLVLQHSDSTDPENSGAQMRETLSAVVASGMRALVVYPCSDQGYEGIIQEIEAHRNSPNISVHKNIPAPDFVGLQAFATCFVGNSSAGLIEAPYFGLPAVNVGFRQIGREHCSNLLSVSYSRDEILKAISKGITKEFKDMCKKIKPPFGDGTSYKKIAKILVETETTAALLNKRMTY